jgi:hypothetical protein
VLLGSVSVADNLGPEREENSTPTRNARSCPFRPISQDGPLPPDFVARLRVKLFL